MNNASKTARKILTPSSIECQRALQPEFDNFFRDAVSAGWSDEDVAVALLDLALNRVTSRIGTPGTGKAGRPLLRAV